MFVRKDAVCAQRVLSVGICMLWRDGLRGKTFRANGMPCKREYSAYSAPLRHTGIIPLFQHIGIVQHTGMCQPYSFGILNIRLSRMFSATARLLASSSAKAKKRHAFDMIIMCVFSWFGAVW
jgi:hypothetical protein